MVISRDKLQLIKQQVSMFDVARMTGLDVNRQGMCCCPFHGEAEPSFKIYPKDRGWHCFGCNESGDIFDYMMKRFGLRLQDAAAQIDTMFGLGVLDTINTRPTRAERRRVRQKLIDIRYKKDKEEFEKSRLERRYDHLCLLNRYLLDTLDWLSKQEDFTTNDTLKEMYMNATFLSDKVEYLLDDYWERIYIDKTWKED